MTLQRLFRLATIEASFYPFLNVAIQCGRRFYFVQGMQREGNCGRRTKCVFSVKWE